MGGSTSRHAGSPAPPQPTATTRSPGPALERVMETPPLLLCITAQLPGARVLLAAQSCRRWREATADQELWLRLLAQDFPGWTVRGHPRGAYARFTHSQLDPIADDRRRGAATVRVQMVGDSGVGRRAFIRRFADGDYKARPGNDQLALQRQLGIAPGIRFGRLEERDVQLWVFIEQPYNAFSSQQSDGTLTRRAQCVLLCYDITDRASFDDCEQQMERVRGAVTKECVIGLVGCKKDLEKARAVPAEQGVALAARWTEEEPGRPRVWYTECSAKTGEGVDQAAVRALRAVLDR